MRLPPQRESKGFSAAELVIAIAILLLVCALVFPMLQKGIQRSRQTVCVGNLKSIGATALLYASDHNGQLPGLLATPAAGGEPANNHEGQQWDAQIMPYMGLDPSNLNNAGATVFFCPSSTRNPAGAKGRQLSYAWNARLVNAPPYSKRLSSLTEPSRVLMALDNKILSDQPDKNQLLLQSAGNTIYVKEDNTLKRVAYERHDGSANMLFADGSVSPRKPVSTTDLRPRGVRFYNTGPLSPE